MSCEKCTPEVQNMCCVCKGAKHEPAPIPEEGKWVKAKQINLYSNPLYFKKII